jgi:hypothetical protein
MEHVKCGINVSAMVPLLLARGGGALMWTAGLDFRKEKLSKEKRVQACAGKSSRSFKKSRAKTS